MLKSLVTTGALSGARFRWFYLGRTVSLFGSGMTPVALAFAVLQVQHGQQLLGYVLAAEILPEVIMVLMGGSVADRYRRDRLLVLSSVGSGLSQSGIAVIVVLRLDPYWILPLAVVNGVLGAFTSPAMRGIIPELVERSDIKQANALLNASRSAAKMLGPTVAGVLVASIGGGFGIAVDAASFFIAAGCLARLDIPSHPTASRESLIQQMRAGWSYFRRQRWIWTVTLSFALMNFVQMGVWRVLGPLIAERSFGASGWGLTLGVQAVGLLLASLVMLKLTLRHPLRDSLLAIAFSGLPMVTLGLQHPLPWLAWAALLAGAGSAVSGIAWDSTLQQRVPHELLSRVCAFDDFGSYIAIPAGVMLAVPVANSVGVHAVAAFGGVLFIAIALLPLFVRAV
ncbi:MFS transporter [Alicyclobacillus sp. ALC3]|uniref:MFS transporter n=1 Tax=Alicyclobacillus sp. ALC3 TaxID=2796143 RepID=UPI0023790326|nr:MFS transporter [Alicyclobacillus sp. ALC3]WDL98334.1 MFS transporter [Alicyclobacillus sp. ALC3]